MIVEFGFTSGTLSNLGSEKGKAVPVVDPGCRM
jgi:hypothetical protein